MRLALPLALSALSASAALAQPLVPAPGPFGDGSLPTAEITISPDTLAAILAPENQQSDVEYRATFTWTDADGQDVVDEVGFRLRGNTSRAAEKKSFKVSFNTYVAGREWRGLDKLNLNGEHNDPTILRSTLAWGWARELRIPAARAHPVRLVINGAFYGVYVNVEHIDDEFLGTHFRDDGGTLYKCLYPADLADLGSDPAAYREIAPFGRPVYELEEGDGDHADLAEFVGFLNRLPDSFFQDGMERVLDVNGYLRVLAFDILMGNWDGYAYNQNNYYLYFDPEIDRVRYIPYDLDNTLGIDFLGPDWGTRSVYAWPEGSLTGGPPRPLAKRLLQFPDYRDRLTFYLRRALDGPLQSAAVEARVAQLRALIADAVAEDPTYPLDYGWDADDFADAFTQPLGGHVPYGLLPFMSARRQSALAELESVDVPPLLSEVRTAPSAPLPGAPVTASVWVEDEGAPASVTLSLRADGGAWTERPMTDEGDEVWTAELGAFPAGTVVDYVVEATDASGQTASAPRAGRDLPLTFTVAEVIDTGLFVNEVLASNDAVLADEAGEFDDWIELYNATGAPVSLAGAFLTDDPDEPQKFALPNAAVPAGGYLIVWADDDTDQGPLHAPFRLSADGESVSLFVPSADGLVLANALTFGEQTTDVSFGRTPDGGAELASFDVPTPGAANAGSTAGEAGPPADAFAVTASLPNPARGAFSLALRLPQAATVEGELVDALGRVAGRFAPQAFPAGTALLDWTRPLGAGVYVAVVRARGADGHVSTASRRVTVVR